MSTCVDLATLFLQHMPRSTKQSRLEIKGVFCVYLYFHVSMLAVIGSG